MTNIMKQCLICKIRFRVYPNHQSQSRKYCSRNCMSVAYKSGLRPVTWGNKISKSKKGHGWPEGYRKRQSIAQKKRFETEVIWNKGKYKNGKISYHTLHKWVQKQLGKPNKCEFCKTT